VDRFEHEVLQWDRIYDGSGPLITRGWNSLTRRNVRQRFDATFAGVPDWTDRSVLDIGCGSGRYLIEAGQRGAGRLVGVDSAPSMIALTRERLAEHGWAADLIVGAFPDVEMLDVPETFDVVLAVGLMDYVVDPRRVVAGIAAHLEGCAVLTFPWRFAPRSIPRSMYWRARGLATTYYRRADITSLLTGAGLRIARIERIGPIFFVIVRPDVANRSA
jgi:SAM-dependent methyltransferase